MKLSRLFTINLLFVAAMIVLSIWTWEQLPPDTKVPVHFDITGSPDEYMGKVGLFLTPAIAFVITIVNPILPKIEPNQGNLQRSGKAYAAFSMAVIVFLSVVHVAIILFTLGKAVDITNIITIALGGFFVIIGNYLGKIRRNYFFGVRTPWTLSSDLAWHKTHRWAGGLTVIHGLAFIIAGLLANIAFFSFTLISFLIASLIVLPVYSYLLWKSDSNQTKG